MGTPDLQSLLADPASAAAAAEALIESGATAVDGARVTLDTLTQLPASEPFVQALNALQDAAPKGQTALRHARLARAFELLGSPKRAAKSLRLALAAPGPPSLSAALALAEGAIAGGDLSLGTGFLDWLAAQLGRRDDRNEDQDQLDPVRRDPYTMCAFLERAARAASSAERSMRAVALFRTAAGRYERMGCEREARRAREGAVEALRRVEKTDLATDFAMRLRVTAKEQDLPEDEAKALGLVAALMARSSDGGDQRKAASCWREASKILTQAGDQAGAIRQILELARTQARLGQAADAAQTFEEALLGAHEAGLPEGLIVEIELAAGALELERGDLGAALGKAEAARRDAPPGTPARQWATLLAARVLAAAGSGGMARKALGKCEVPLDARDLAGASLSVRAELALVDARPDDALAFHAEAARVLETADPRAAAASRLRRVELLIESGEQESAKAELARARSGSLEPGLALWAEICETLLSEDPDELEILLEEFAERAELEGGPAHRMLVLAPKVASHMRMGDEGTALETLQGALDVLIAVRDGLPKPLRKGFARSPLCRGLLALGDHEALAAELKRLTG